MAQEVAPPGFCGVESDGNQENLMHKKRKIFNKRLQIADWRLEIEEENVNVKAEQEKQRLH